jgi:GT2 family glycosyltransferase
MKKVTVVITLLSDIKVLKTLESLKSQTRKPDLILVADGGSNKNFIQQLNNFINKNNFQNIEIKIFPGRCIDTRREVITYLMEKTNIVAFIDSDEFANDKWLETLVKPIEENVADFTGGPIFPVEAISNAERILNIIQTQNNEIVKKDISYIPMGNSAWEIGIFEKLGNFDDSSVSSQSGISGVDIGKNGISYYVSEDFDLNVRAQHSGFKGVFCKDAIVFHNQSRINSFRLLTKYFYSLFVRTSMAYFKNRVPISKVTKVTREFTIIHPFQGFLYLIKPFAFIRGWIEWNKLVKRR